MPFPGAPNTGNPQWDQGLAGLSGIFFRDPSAVAMAGYYGAMAREKSLEGDLAQRKVAVTDRILANPHLGLRYEQNAPQPPPQPMPQPGPQGMMPPPDRTAPPYSPGLVTGLAHILGDNAQNPLTAGTPPAMASPAPGANSPAVQGNTATDGSLPQNIPGEGPIKLGSILQPNTGLQIMSSPAQSNGSAAPPAVDLPLLSTLYSVAGFDAPTIQTNLISNLNEAHGVNALPDPLYRDFIASYGQPALVQERTELERPAAVAMSTPAEFFPNLPNGTPDFSRTVTLPTFYGMQQGLTQAHNFQPNLAKGTTNSGMAGLQREGTIDYVTQNEFGAPPHGFGDNSRTDPAMFMPKARAAIMARASEIFKNDNTLNTDEANFPTAVHQATQEFQSQRRIWTKQQADQARKRSLLGTNRLGGTDTGLIRGPVVNGKQTWRFGIPLLDGNGKSVEDTAGGGLSAVVTGPQAGAPPGAGPFKEGDIVRDNQTGKTQVYSGRRLVDPSTVQPGTPQPMPAAQPQAQLQPQAPAPQPPMPADFPQSDNLSSILPETKSRSLGPDLVTERARPLPEPRGRISGHVYTIPGGGVGMLQGNQIVPLEQAVHVYPMPHDLRSLSGGRWYRLPDGGIAHYEGGQFKRYQ